MQFDIIRWWSLSPCFQKDRKSLQTKRAFLVIRVCRDMQEALTALSMLIMEPMSFRTSRRKVRQLINIFTRSYLLVWIFGRRLKTAKTKCSWIFGNLT